MPGRTFKAAEYIAVGPMHNAIRLCVVVVGLPRVSSAVLEVLARLLPF